MAKYEELLVKQRDEYLTSKPFHDLKRMRLQTMAKLRDCNGDRHVEEGQSIYAKKQFLQLSEVSQQLELVSDQIDENIHLMNNQMRVLKTNIGAMVTVKTTMHQQSGKLHEEVDNIRIRLAKQTEDAKAETTRVIKPKADAEKQQRRECYLKLESLDKSERQLRNRVDQMIADLRNNYMQIVKCKLYYSFDH